MRGVMPAALVDLGWSLASKEILYSDHLRGWDASMLGRTSLISREIFLKWRLERGGLRPAEDAGDVALRLLIAPGVFLGRLLVPGALV